MSHNVVSCQEKYTIKPMDLLIWTRFFSKGGDYIQGRFITGVQIYMEKHRLKSHTHVKKVGHTSECLFGIYWWIWKTNIYLKNCWGWSIKNKIILIITMLHLKKIKKNTWRYYFTPVNQKSSWYDLRICYSWHYLLSMALYARQRKTWLCTS